MLARGHGIHPWLALLAALVLSGCQGSLPTLTDDLPTRVELDDVPFFPQAEFQCGPAALATVLQRSNVSVTPDTLVPLVYLPGRKGSLQTELIAATRRFDRVPYVLPTSVRAVLREVQSQRPVLVLQNLGLRHWPQWHFAVVVGFDRASGQVILRSGTKRRELISLRRFANTWERGGQWAMVVLRPHELPAEPEPERYLMAAAGLEAVGHLDSAAAAYDTARAAWPGSSWPLLGLANIAYRRKQFVLAESLYRELLADDPSHVTARYNLADTLVQRGCMETARLELRRGLAVSGDSPMRSRLQEMLGELNAQPGVDRDGCSCGEFPAEGSICRE